MRNPVLTPAARFSTTGTNALSMIGVADSGGVPAALELRTMAPSGVGANTWATTDPRTTVSTRRGQCLVAFTVAAVEMVLRLAEVIHAPYYALFLVGPTALAMELAWKKRLQTATTTAAESTASQDIQAAAPLMTESSAP